MQQDIKEIKNISHGPRTILDDKKESVLNLSPKLIHNDKKIVIPVAIVSVR